MNVQEAPRTNGRLGVKSMVIGNGHGQGVTPLVVDSEVIERPTRRSYTAEYKLRIVREADACANGETGALLRREGLYSSQLSKWRRQRETGELDGLSSRKRGRKRRSRNPLEGQLKETQRENRRLKRRLHRAETVIEVQKKLSEMLGIPLDPVALDESDED